MIISTCSSSERMCTVFSPTVNAMAMGMADAMIRIATPAIDSIVILIE